MHETTKSAFVKRKTIEILPQMYKYISNVGHFSDQHLTKAMTSILKFLELPLKKEKDPGMKDHRGQGFIALGKMSLLVPKDKFVNYLALIFDTIRREIELAKHSKT